MIGMTDEEKDERFSVRVLCTMHIFVSTDKSSYSVNVLLVLLSAQPLFEISAIFVIIFSFSFCKLNAD